MADAYTQIHLHMVFGVLYRRRLIPPEHSEIVRQYITGIVQNRRHKMLCINNVPDHFHMLVGFHPAESPSKLMQDVKVFSTHFINAQDWMKTKFYWERGYGAFSVSHSQISRVCQYITNQQEHHREITFGQEYEDLLNRHGISYKKKYIFHQPPQPPEGA